MTRNVNTDVLGRSTATHPAAMLGRRIKLRMFIEANHDRPYFSHIHRAALHEMLALQTKLCLCAPSAGAKDTVKFVRDNYEELVGGTLLFIDE